jgi:hypothetical protein
MKKLLIGLLYENNEPSLTRIIAVIAFIVPLTAFLLVTVYLLLAEREWGSYQTFATATMGGGATGALMQLINKVSNTFGAAPSGQPFVKNNGDGK